MALEINEIGIRLRIYGDTEAKTPKTLPRSEESSPASLRAEIVDACVKKVLHILKSAEER